MVTITLRRLNNFHFAGKKYVNANKKSKLTFAIEKVIRKTKVHLEDLADEEAGIKELHAKCDDKGILLYDSAGRLCYSKESMKAMREDLRIAFSKEIRFEEHIVYEFDEDTLTHDLREIFSGIVIPEIDFDKEIESINPEK